MSKAMLIATILVLGTGPALAEWHLDNRASHLSFVSIKAVDIAEVHRFVELSGQISDSGKAEVSISLESVDTGIEIRDERMQSMLFHTDKHPNAEVRAKLDKSFLRDLMPGTSTNLDVEFTVEINDREVPVTTTVLVSRLSETALSVSNIEPVIFNANSADLGGGVEELRKVANLPSISIVVPVSFVLSFTR